MKSKSMSYYVKSLIGLAIMFGFRYLPPIGPLTPLGMQVTGIFIGLIYLCCVVDIIWPSMVGLIALGMLMIHISILMSKELRFLSFAKTALTFMANIIMILN